MRADFRLAVPTAVAWVALAILIAMPAVVLPAALVAWIGAVASLVLAVRREGWRHPLVVVALTLVIAALFLSSAAANGGRRSPEAMTEAADAGLRVTATAVMTGKAHGDQRWFAASLQSVTAGGRESAASVPVMVFGSIDRSAQIGSKLLLSGTLGKTAPEEAAAFLFFLDGEAEVAGDPTWYVAWAGGLRSTFLEHATALPGDGGALLPGLAIGDTGAVTEALDTAMKASSLSHLTAVSGANCAVIIGLIMFGGGAIGMPRGWRIGMSIGVLLGFVVLVTPEPSVLRAAVMATLVLVALASGRPMSGIPVLSVAVIILLAFDPWLCRSYGFVLSVLATAGLLLLAGPLAKALTRILPYPLAAVIAVPLAAQLACQPVLILLSPTIPTYGVIANVLAGPAAPVATVVGLVACLLLPWFPPLGILVASVAWLPSAWIAAVAAFFSQLPGSRLPWPPGAVGIALVVTVTLAGLYIVLVRSDRHRRSRRLAAVVLAAVCIGYLGTAGGDQLRRRLAPPDDWQIAGCDVGQGDAMLVRSAGAVALIDTGPDPEALGYCLDTLGVTEIDLLVLTHFDLDHVGGATAVMGRVDQLIVGPTAGADDERLVRSLIDAGASSRQVSKGERGLLGDLRWQVLWPPAELRGFEPGNDASVVLGFTGVGACPSGCLSSAFLGDLGEEAQNRLLSANQLSPVDVVKVAHHGSRDQSTRLYEKLQGSVGIIGVGAANDYGHPTDAILQTLSAGDTAVLRTDLHGLVLVSSTDGAIQAWTEHSSVGEPD